MANTRTEIGDLWRLINREIHERFRQAMQESDSNFGMLMVLRQIQRQPGVTVSEIARRAGHAKSHVSKMIEQLSRQGYLEKRPDPSDQRLLHVYLTPSATERVAEIEALAQAAWGRVMDQVPEGEVEAVARGLRILAAALERSKES